MGQQNDQYKFEVGPKGEYIHIETHDTFIEVTMGADGKFKGAFGRVSVDKATLAPAPPSAPTSDDCPFTFKSKECGYRGPVDTCDKTFDCCRDIVGNEERFGAARS